MQVDGWLYAAQAAFAVGSKITEYNDTVTARHIDFANKTQQAHLNNGLAYNYYLNINEEKMLENKKFRLDEFELNKQIRAVVATQLVRDGSVLKSGGSANSTLMNIYRKGHQALHRKEFNFHTKLRNLKMQKKNMALETQSKNTALFNSLKGFPSLTGLALDIGGTAVQTGIKYGEGRQLKEYKQNYIPSPTITTKPKAPEPSYWDTQPYGNMARQGKSSTGFLK